MSERAPSAAGLLWERLDTAERRAFVSGVAAAYAEVFAEFTRDTEVFGRLQERWETHLAEFKAQGVLPR